MKKVLTIKSKHCHKSDSFEKKYNFNRKTTEEKLLHFYKCNLSIKDFVKYK